MSGRRLDKELAPRSSAAEYLTFVAASGSGGESFEVRYEDENIWLTQKMMAALYGVDVRTINEHIKKIYSDGELTDEGNYPENPDSSAGGRAYGEPRDYSL